MGSIILKFALMVAAILFFSAIFFFAVHVMPYEGENGIFLFNLGSFDKISMVMGAVGLIGYLTIILLPDRSTTEKPKRRHMVFWIITLIISTPFAVTKALFGINEVEPILIFFRDNQMDDMLTVGIDGFTGPIKLWLVLLLVIIICSFFVRAYKKHFRKVLSIISLALLALSPLVQYISNSILPNAAQRDFIITERMHAPVILQKPVRQKNIVIIYLESVERSYGDIPEFAPYYAPIKKLAAQSVEFTNVVQTVGTNYSIAGLVASQCGIPLISNGLQKVFFRGGVEASMKNFLSSVQCIGDQLTTDGYTLSHSSSSSLDQFSQRSFLQEHGYSRLFGPANLSEAEKQGRSNVWGLNDALVFETATAEFDTLAAMPAPFMQSIATVSTHGPNAFLDNGCIPIANAASHIPQAIQCTGNLIIKLLDHIRASDAADDTIIVLLSDHLAFFNSAKAQLDSIGAARRNLFMIIGAGRPQKIDRKMAPYDIYPTLLEALGYKLKDGRANMGVSLYSDTQNLAEELGVATLNKVFKGNQKLATYLWRDK